MVTYEVLYCDAHTITPKIQKKSFQEGQDVKVWDWGMLLSQNLPVEQIDPNKHQLKFDGDRKEYRIIRIEKLPNLVPAKAIQDRPTA